MKKIVKVYIMCLQVISALALSGFVYCQTQLISSLEEKVMNLQMAIMTVILFLVYMVFEAAENYIRERTFSTCMAETKKKVASAFFSRSVLHYNEKSEEQHLSFLTNEVSAVLNQNIYLRLYEQKQFISVLFALLTLLLISRECSIAVCLAAVAFGIAIHLLSKRLTDKQRWLQDKKSVFVEKLMELHQGFDEIHINQMEALVEQEFKKANREAEYAQYGYRMLLGKLELLSVGQNMMIYMLVLWVGGILAYEGVVGLGIFVSAAELSVQALNQWMVIARIHTLVKGSKQLRDKLDAYVSEQELFQRPITQAQGDSLIEVQAVSVCNGEELPLLENVNLTIRKGRKYLFTGESGCGKSTLLEVLMGHKICFGGEVKYYTDNIAYLPQEPFLFHGTLRENITFGQKKDDSVLEAFLDKVCLELPLDMIVEDEGRNLSGGQKARVALVRALVTEPELLIADEITSNLDSRLGRKIEEMLLKEYPQMALCIVAHRVCCREAYDTIYEIRGKEVCEVKG